MAATNKQTEPFNHAEIEAKWRKRWEETPVNVNDGKKEKYYCLDMFPYPSGSGLHVGHWRGYVISDVWSRYQMMKDMKPYLEMSESTLYTILKRLEAGEMLTVRSAEHGGRLRKYYRITQRGLDRIAEFREDWNMILSIYRFITREEGEHE